MLLPFRTVRTSCVQAIGVLAKILGHVIDLFEDAHSILAKRIGSADQRLEARG